MYGDTIAQFMPGSFSHDYIEKFGQAHLPAEMPNFIPSSLICFLKRHSS